jgi:hypothetical protein
MAAALPKSRMSSNPAAANESGKHVTGPARPRDVVKIALADRPDEFVTLSRPGLAPDELARRYGREVAFLTLVGDDAAVVWPAKFVTDARNPPAAYLAHLKPDVEAEAATTDALCHLEYTGDAVVALYNVPLAVPRVPLLKWLAVCLEDDDADLSAARDGLDALVGKLEAIDNQIALLPNMVSGRWSRKGHSEVGQRGRGRGWQSDEVASARPTRGSRKDGASRRERGGVSRI